MVRVAVVRFPGSNCDWDAYHAAESAGAESACQSKRSSSLVAAALP